MTRTAAIAVTAAAALGLAACGSTQGHTPAAASKPAASAAASAHPAATAPPLPGPPATMRKLACDFARLIAVGGTTYSRVLAGLDMMYVDKHMTIPVRAEVRTYMFTTVTRSCPQYIQAVPAP